MKKILKKSITLVVLSLILVAFTLGISVAFAQESVYIGGEIVGFSIPYDGVRIVSVNNVDTESGEQSLKHIFVKGDRIISVDGVKVKKVGDISIYLSKIADNKCVKIEYERNGKISVIEVVPLKDKQSGVKKLGIIAKDNVSGLGTLTYVEKDGDFGALGHAVTDSETGTKIESNSGSLYNCAVNGIKKGEKGSAGAICGYLTGQKIGELENANKFGIYGKTVISNGEVYEIAPREEVKPGKAQICSSVSGQKEYYDIEIIRAFYQKTDRDKGLIIKVKDKRLISLTGGIVQGMSGSPIIQNGKIVGAVTHVFVNDPTRGYGIYIDNMIA
ncbi:MAG: PDZ domain-containing protein [Clostridiales bacterium]|nr:PDZ domain-containing protein [Clostridiales bacterium]